MAGNEVPVILDASVTLDRGSNEVADLRKDASQSEQDHHGDDRVFEQSQRIAEHKAVERADARGKEYRADGTLDSLLRAQFRRQLMFSEQESRAVGTDVGAPGREKGQGRIDDAFRQQIRPVNVGQKDRNVKDGEGGLGCLGCRIFRPGEDVSAEDQHQGKKQGKHQTLVPAEPDSLQKERSTHETGSLKPRLS